MILLIIIALACALFYYVAIKPLSYWRSRGVPHKTPFPIVGNYKKLLFHQTSISDFTLNLYNEFSNERYYGIHQFMRPLLYIKDLDLLKKITVKDFEHFTDHTTISEEADPLIGKNLLNLKGQRWRDMRTTLSPSFTSSKMKMMFQLITECAEDFVKYFEEQGDDLLHVEMKDVFSRFTNDAIATVAFGIKCNSLEDQDNEFYVMGKRASTFSGFKYFVILLHSIMPTLAKGLGLRLLTKSVGDFFMDVIKETVYKREHEGLVRLDMIHLLVQARKGKSPKDDNIGCDEEFILTDEPKQKAELTDEDITAQALIFFFGGFDTSSTLMSFLAYELAMNGDVQKRLQEEIDETLKCCNGKVTYDAILKMKYMDMVVSETLRIWPPAPFVDRICVKDYTIEPVHPWEKTVTIEKGTLLHLPIIGIHRDPKYHPDPDKFDPERFNDEKKHNMEPSAYLPFGSGPRICIASRFALMENKTLLFHLLSKFNIVRTTKTPYPLRLAPSSLNIGSADGFWLGLKRR